MRVRSAFSTAWLTCVALACGRPAWGTEAPATAAAGPRLAAVAASTEGPHSAPSARAGYAYANTDPDDDLVVAPPASIAGCSEQLSMAGVKFSSASIPTHKQGKLLCGADQLVNYKKGPGRIAYNGAPPLTCIMALSLARAETVIQEEALRVFGKRVKAMHQMGTYSCREIAAYPGWVSEHSYANAIDLDTFTLEGGKVILVSKHFSKSAEEPATKEGQFLRAISRRLYDEDVFSSVLTPFFNQAHWNHFHIDQSHFRNDGTRPRE